MSNSLLRYGGAAWIGALETKRNRSRLSSVHRLSAMRVVSAYRTISYEAVCVIAGMMPICIVIKEDSECFHTRAQCNDGGASIARALHRDESLRKWQEEWDNSTKGRWTHRLIPRIKEWVNRPHGELTSHLTQFLSGHGCFQQYLHRFGHAVSPLCADCEQADETPEHVVFVCPRFEKERWEMRTQAGQIVSADNIVTLMCRDEHLWHALNQGISSILMKLQAKRREDVRVQ